jgi:hypothetical protein
MSNGTRSLSPVTLRVLSVACISLTAASRQPALAVVAAAVGLTLYAWSLRVDDSRADPHSFRWAGLAVILILLIRFSGSVEQFAESEEAARPIWIAFVLTAAVIAVLAGHRRIPRLVSIGVGMLAVLLMTGVMTVGEWRSEVGTDVYWMHREAGEALSQGLNPYTDAVRVFDGNPFAPEGAVVEGYPYPPIIVGTYAVTAYDLDPRLMSSLAWIVALGWMASRARRPGDEGSNAYAIFLLMSGLAVWPVVWYASWTEPLSIALLLLSATWWRRRPVLSAITLGLALASKQYFIFLAPLLLLHRDESKKMRLGVSLGVAATTILVGLAVDSSAYITATISNLTDVGFRPDTQSMSGLLASIGIDLYLPSGVWVILVLGLATIIARGSSTVSDFLGRSALILGLAFILGRAFMNYWFLVSVLVALASVFREAETRRRDDDPRVRSSSVPAIHKPAT